MPGRQSRETDDAGASGRIAGRTVRRRRGAGHHRRYRGLDRALTLDSSTRSRSIQPSRARRRRTPTARRSTGWPTTWPTPRGWPSRRRDTGESSSSRWASSPRSLRSSGRSRPHQRWHNGRYCPATRTPTPTSPHGTRWSADMRHTPRGVVAHASRPTGHLLVHSPRPSRSTTRLYAATATVPQLNRAPKPQEDPPAETKILTRPLLHVVSATVDEAGHTGGLEQDRPAGRTCPGPPAFGVRRSATVMPELCARTPWLLKGPRSTGSGSPGPFVRQVTRRRHHRPRRAQSLPSAGVAVPGRRAFRNRPGNTAVTPATR